MSYTKYEYIRQSELKEEEKNELVEKIIKKQGYVEFQQFMNYKITRLNIPEGVTKIYGRAFENCTELQSVYIPDSVDFIDWRSFKDCKKLREVRLSNSLNKISALTFYNCTSLVSIEIPKSVKYFEKDAFAYCSNLNTIILHNPFNSLLFHNSATNKIIVLYYTIRKCDKLKYIIVDNNFETFDYSDIRDITIIPYNEYMAARVIQYAFREARYNPEYLLCKTIFEKGINLLLNNNS